MEIQVLSGADVQKALPMPVAIAAMREAFGQLSGGEAIMPPRTHIGVTEHGGVAEFMPAYLPVAGNLTVKIVSVYPQNTERELPTIHALVVVLDEKTGRPLALIEGASLTAIRTGAATGLATDLLARSEARTVAIFGSGVQARTNLEAVCTVRPIDRAWVYSPDTDRARYFAEEMAGQGMIPADIRIARSPSVAIAEADIICTATTSTTPVFDGRELRPGTHINAIGCFTPSMREIGSEVVKRALVVVDSKEAGLAEAGELIIPIEQGIITADWIHAELGEIVNGHKVGRTDPEQITLFKSVGVAVQDAAAVGRVLAGTTAMELGRLIQV